MTRNFPAFSLGTPFVPTNALCLFATVDKIISAGLMVPQINYTSIYSELQHLRYAL